MKTIPSLVRLFVIFLACAYQIAVASAAEPTYALVEQWQNKELKHQHEAQQVFRRDRYFYVGGGAPEGKVAKVNLQTGAVAWTYNTQQTYQPSYPVSNGRVVIFGTYYSELADTEPRSRTYFVGLDDATGKLLWKIPAGQQNMSGACFAADLAFIGSYDRNLYAIDWAKGEIRWKAPLGTRIWSTPCIYENLIIIGCYDGKLYCFDRDTGKLDSTIDCGGRIESDPVIANGLLFMAVDAGNLGEKHNSSNEQRTMLVYSLPEKRIVIRFRGDSSFSKKIVVSGDDVYFFDDRWLWAYQSRQADLSWRAEAPAGMAPYPIITPTRILLAMNYVGHHGDHSSKIVVLDRATGKLLSTQASGGIGMQQPLYVQSSETVVDVEYGLAGYLLTVIP